MSNRVDPLAVFRRFSALVPRHWRRRRGSLGPAQVVLSLMVMTILGTKGYERTLDEMKLQLGKSLGWENADDVPSVAALCQARRKLDAKRCSELVSQVRELCSAARTGASVGYGGFRLLAVDGTKLALPAYPAIRQHFGCPTQGEGGKQLGPQASLTVLWDVGANQPVAWHVAPYRTNEKEQARALVPAIGAGDLVLGDRNFPSRRFLTMLHHCRAEALMRIRSTGACTLHAVAEFVASGARDALVQITTCDEQAKPCEDLPTLTVRLLRATLPNGSEAFYLTTLLDQQRHPAQALIDLYAQRWRIETAFRELKIWHGLERFHARHVDGIAQEIAAVMIFQLLTSELEAQVKLKHDAEFPPPPTTANSEPLTVQVPTIQFNRRIVADCAIRLLCAAAGQQDLAKAFHYALFRIWRYRQKIRPRRSFPRNRQSPARGWKPPKIRKKSE